MNIFKRFWNYINTWREHRDVIKQLNQLTDKQLDDIGFTRGDIDRIIWLERDKAMRRMGYKG